MRDVDQPDDPVDQRVAQGDERVERPGPQARHRYVQRLLRRGADVPEQPRDQEHEEQDAGSTAELLATPEHRPRVRGLDARHRHGAEPLARTAYADGSP